MSDHDLVTRSPTPGDKTPGQYLYEYTHPSHTAMVPLHKRHFATMADVVYVRNEQYIEWKFLTKETHARYEAAAKYAWFPQKDQLTSPTE